MIHFFVFFFCFFEWAAVTTALRSRARNWFIERAVARGVPWDVMMARHDQKRLEEVYHTLRDDRVVVPDYFLRPFHGYDDGNMCWQAARELEASTLSMSANYWPQHTVDESQQALRDGFVHLITYDGAVDDARAYVDFGSSIGISTRMTRNALRARGIRIDQITAVDLSPYFIATGAQTAADNVTFVHDNIESTSLSSKSADLLTICFVFHEMPQEATQQVLREAYRILRKKAPLQSSI